MGLRGQAELSGAADARRGRASLLLMLASGFAGLGYQIVWTQQSALWLGHETAAVLAVVGAFFGGSLLIETLFSLDGLGLLSYESVIRRDYPVVFGSLYVFTLIGLLTHLIRDLSYLWVDPRVKYFD